MSPAILVPVVAILSAAVAFVVIMNGRRLRPPSATNHRGKRLPVILGMAVTAGIVVGGLAALLSDLRAARTLPTIRGTLQILGGLVGILFIAGATNLWNLLDVAPGRSTKFFVLAAVALEVAIAAASRDAPRGFSVFVITGLAAALVALPFDLREHAMLGDGGANVLGFLVGAGLYVKLSTGWLWIGLAVVVALTLLAETVTLTRLIRAVPPLRWFDDLGRAAAVRAEAPGKSLVGER
jgi:hypothetical protein